MKIEPQTGYCSGHGTIILFRDRCSKCLARDYPNGADKDFPADMREDYAAFLSEGKTQ